MNQECSNHVPDTRRGTIDQFHIKLAGEHTVHFDADQDFSHVLTGAGSRVGGAEGGYLLIRFDVDDEPYTVVHVDPPGGWWPVEGKSPADMIYRGREYLSALSDKLEKFERIIDAAHQ